MNDYTIVKISYIIHTLIKMHYNKKRAIENKKEQQALYKIKSEEIRERNNYLTLLKQSYLRYYVFKLLRVFSLLPQLFPAHTS